MQNSPLSPLPATQSGEVVVRILPDQSRPAARSSLTSFPLPVITDAVCAQQKVRDCTHKLPETH